MTKARTHLKNSSIIVLALGALTLINLLFELFFGELNGELQNAVIPEGSPENIILITKTFVLVVSLLFVLPQLYIGFKGLKMAKEPDSSRGHIVWGIILAVFTFISLLTTIISLIQGDGDALANASEALSIAVDFAVLVHFVKYAIAVRNEI